MVTVTTINKTISFEIMSCHKIWSLQNKLNIPKDKIIKVYQDES
ncbi:hypothetical protein FVB9288_00563 [Flavobacterium sp. CECT 9288]|nr:hypothetical protein [Flavobacterium sp. CECT 9288]CAH0334946.1 hypothetical protein FVB9288_00563 [Flavobacterium sp. CECT 9288]